MDSKIPALHTGLYSEDAYQIVCAVRAARTCLMTAFNDDHFCTFGRVRKNSTDSPFDGIYRDVTGEVIIKPWIRQYMMNTFKSDVKLMLNDLASNFDNDEKFFIFVNFTSSELLEKFYNMKGYKIGEDEALSDLCRVFRKDHMRSGMFLYEKTNMDQIKKTPFTIKRLMEVHSLLPAGERTNVDPMIVCKRKLLLDAFFRGYESLTGTLDSSIGILSRCFREPLREDENSAFTVFDLMHTESKNTIEEFILNKFNELLAMFPKSAENVIAKLKVFFETSEWIDMIDAVKMIDSEGLGYPDALVLAKLYDTNVS